MSATGSARLLALGATWRLTGAGPAGRALVRATCRDDDGRELAGMLLVQAGDRSVPVVARALLTGQASVELVTVLASIGSDEARAALRRVSRSTPPTVEPELATAAADALRLLEP